MAVFPVLVLSLILNAAILRDASAEPESSSTPAAHAASNEEVQARMKASVHAAKSRLGLLEDWQNEVYSEEVIPHYSRFIQENLDVDMEGIRRYLTFSGSRIFSGSTPKLLLFVKGEPDCNRCLAVSSELREIVENVAHRRGFEPSWVSQEEIGDNALFWEELDERVHELSRLRSSAAIWVIQTRKTPVDNIDTAHARDKIYQLRSYMLVRSEREMRKLVHVDVGLRDHFENAAAQAVVDTFLFMGGEVLASLAPAEEDKDEISLVVPGAGDYARFMKIKTLLETGLKSVGEVQERRLSRSQVVFSLRTNSAPEAVRRIIRSLSTPETPVQVSNLDGRTIWVEIPIAASTQGAALVPASGENQGGVRQ